MLMSLHTTAEEWFRIEILGVVRGLAGISIEGTNHQSAMKPTDRTSRC